MTNPPEWARARRAGWRWTGAERPFFAVAPNEGQESVWDYPRPPRVIADRRLVVVRAGDVLLAESRRSIRVLETASPPTFYVPVEDVAAGCLQPGHGESRCEWKGVAHYWDAVLPDERRVACAWSYPNPFPEFASIRRYRCFYPARLECFVDGARVMAQPGNFYGGWVTRELVGPFKGEPGSECW